MLPTPLVLLLGLFVLLGRPGFCLVHTLENDVLVLRLDDESGLFTVEDKRAGYRWTQSSTGSGMRVGEVRTVDLPSGPEIRARLDSSPPFNARFLFGSSPTELIVELIPSDRSAAMREPLNYPAPFVMAPDRGNILWLYQEGMVMPAREAYFQKRIPQLNRLAYSYRELNAFALTDWRQGLLVIVDAPDNARFEFVELQDDKGAYLARQIVWDPALGKADHTRRIIYRFQTGATHVTLMKSLRSYYRDRGMLRTLREKARLNPNVHRLPGAVKIYLWKDARTVEFLNELHASGIDRAIVGWDPNHPPYTTREWVERAAELGFIPSVYDSYRPVVSEQYRRMHSLRDMNRTVFPGVYPWGVIRPRPNDETLAKIGNRPEDGRYIICDTLTPRLARERILPELRKFPYRGRFLDTWAANPLRECHHPHHPMRARESRLSREELGRFVADELRLVVGSENVSAWAIPVIHYFEGTMLLERFKDPGQRPRRRQDDPDHQMYFLMDPEKAGPNYVKYGLGPEYRLPLMELVFHDCAVSTWHWRNSNHRIAGFWNVHDLYNILYGSMPLWNLNREYWEAHQQQFAQSYRNVSGWWRKVAMDEMTDHRWLTQDRKVQQSDFSSGWSVIVNFGDSVHLTAGGEEVSPGSFHTFRR